MRILVAEDDPVYRSMLEQELVKWGHEVVTISNGTEAWQTLLEKNSPELVILDWLMPGMDAIDILQDISKNLQQKNPW